MEELVALVGELAEKYTSHESTSVTYETAQQLMEGVLYCIREAQKGQIATEGEDGPGLRKLYGIGRERIQEKVKKTLALYNEMTPSFVDYGNHCLHDTFLVQMPVFFKRYDAYFMPHYEILTLDYPVLQDISGLQGVDKVEAFLRCISLEQAFLRQFSEAKVCAMLCSYHRDYPDLVENLCGIVCGVILEETYLETEERETIREAVAETLKNYDGGNRALREYISVAADAFLARKFL